MQDIDLQKNKNFVKVIEHEYACRYLEKLNIEANQKNIQFILKKYPIKNCDIRSEWNSKPTRSLPLNSPTHPHRQQLLRGHDRDQHSKEGTDECRLPGVTDH